MNLVDSGLAVCVREQYDLSGRVSAASSALHPPVLLLLCQEESLRTGLGRAFLDGRHIWCGAGACDQFVCRSEASIRDTETQDFNSFHVKNS